MDVFARRKPNDMVPAFPFFFSLESGDRVGQKRPVENKILHWNRKEDESYNNFFIVNQVCPLFSFLFVSLFDSAFPFFQVFAKTILDLVRDGDVIWVHDYHSRRFFI